MKRCVLVVCLIGLMLGSAGTAGAYFLVTEAFTGSQAVGSGYTFTFDLWYGQTEADSRQDPSTTSSLTLTTDADRPDATKFFTSGGGLTSQFTFGFSNAQKDAQVQIEFTVKSAFQDSKGNWKDYKEKLYDKFKISTADGTSGTLVHAFTADALNYFDDKGWAIITIKSDNKSFNITQAKMDIVAPIPPAVLLLGTGLLGLVGIGAFRKRRA